jgi:TPR repeat protein
MLWLLPLLLAGDIASPDRATEPSSVNVANAYRACSLVGQKGGDTDGCMALALAYQRGDETDAGGKPIPVNYALAVRFFEVACKAGVPFACISAGEIYEKGHLKPKKRGDPRLVAVGYYTLGCLKGTDKEGYEGETRLSCASAGTTTLLFALDQKPGKRQAKLIATAATFLEKACQMGDDPSCKALVEIEETLNK